MAYSRFWIVEICVAIVASVPIPFRSIKLISSTSKDLARCERKTKSKSRRKDPDFLPHLLAHPQAKQELF